MIRLLMVSILSLLLQSCFFVVGAAAGAAAVAVVYDHRTIENTLQDTQLATAIADRIKAQPALYRDSHIEITVFNRVVLLTGETPNPMWREQAEYSAKSVKGVGRVYNQITIQGPVSSLTKTSDTWITTKLKGQMLAMQDLKSSSIKVVTENGTVFLMGIVTQDQANTVVDIAKELSGVQKVVKIFQYTTQ